ncbi:MAG: YitT family protein [Defluviitaleaceae bacterium]|nr:YitT family protein [Defluviitaleaceae bacterium]
MTKKQTRKQLIREYVMLIAGVYLMAFSLVAFWAPHHLVTGGVSGLAIVIQDYSMMWTGFAVPLWASNLALNIPLFLLGFRTMGRSFFFRSLVGMMLFSLAMHNLTFLPPIPSDMLLGALFGGVFCGIAVALIVRGMGSTGGTMLLASVLHHRLLRHVSIAKLLFGCDALIVLIGLVAFGPERAMYAVIAIFACTKVTDAVLEGFSFAKAAYIISDQAEEISTEIFKQLDRGATEIQARGMYTKERRGMLMCVVSGRELVRLKQLVSEIDPKAFVIVADVKEVLGEGFTAHSM